MTRTSSHCPECEEALAAGRDPPKGHPAAGEGEPVEVPGLLAGRDPPWSFDSDVT